MLDADIYAVTGDYGNVIKLTLKVAGKPIDLATAAHVYLYAQHTLKRSAYFTGEAAVVHPTVVNSLPTGRADYTFANGDITVSGEYNVQVQVVWSDGHKTTIPNAGYKRLDVTKSLRRG